MPISIVIILIILAVVVAVLGTSFWGRRRENPTESLQLLQGQLSDITRMLDSKLGESSRILDQSLRSQFSESAKLIRETTSEIGKLQATNQVVAGFASELQSLQDILKSPKQRGILGEYYLETVLGNVLPPSQFQMQYKFEDGDIVDAVVFLDQKRMLPVDSKFSLENYNRLINEKDELERDRIEKLFRQDLKNRIDETAKYIKPNENTMDFAFMFIPSEAIFYDLLVNQVGAIKSSTQDLIEYAYKQKRVIIVSPTSFFAYLQTVMQGLRSLQIEESAKEIKKRVEELGRHVGAYTEYMTKLGKSLETSVSHYNNAHHEFEKIDKDVYRVTGEAPGVEPLRLDKPSEIL